MNGRPKCQVVADLTDTIALNKPLHDPQGGIDVAVVFSFQKISDHLTEVNCTVTNLSVLPVDDVETWDFQLLCIQCLTIGQQNTSTEVIQINIVYI